MTYPLVRLSSQQYRSKYFECLLICFWVPCFSLISYQFVSTAAIWIALPLSYWWSGLFWWGRVVRSMLGSMRADGLGTKAQPGWTYTFLGTWFYCSCCPCLSALSSWPVSSIAVGHCRCPMQLIWPLTHFVHHSLWWGSPFYFIGWWWRCRGGRPRPWPPTCTCGCPGCHWHCRM